MSVERLTIEDLAKIVAERRGADPDTSYTARLLSRGVGQCAKKLGEEAVETVIAALSGDREQLTAETADLIYHLAVLLEAAGGDIEDVHAELGRRHGVSGLAEKASRRW